jgi:hypothetical protein
MQQLRSVIFFILDSYISLLFAHTQKYSKLFTVDDAGKTNILGFRDNFFYETEGSVEDDQAYNKLSGKKD